MDQRLCSVQSTPAGVGCPERIPAFNKTSRPNGHRPLPIQIIGPATYASAVRKLGRFRIRPGIRFGSAL